MQNSKNALWNAKFSHIYIEKDACNHPNTKKILSHFPNALQVEIGHYKDVFNRGHQNFIFQKQSPKLILAIKKESLLYEGAAVCENFGNAHFYYTSSIMNCIYDCEYCYLQGMYPSANIVVFVNIEDIFYEVEELLKKHPVYLCISYDTDLLAFEGITSFVSLWLELARRQPDLKIEVRTKSANFHTISHIPPLKNGILAWTLSPQQVTRMYEVHTPSLNARLQSAKEAMDKGWKVRLCFDPLLYIKDWREHYNECVEEAFQILKPEKIYDVSVGVFRISKTYLNKMRKERAYSHLLAYPFECYDGVCSYSEKHTKEMISFLYEKIQKYIAQNKIYI